MNTNFLKTVLAFEIIFFFFLFIFWGILIYQAEWNSPEFYLFIIIALGTGGMYASGIMNTVKEIRNNR